MPSPLPSPLTGRIASRAGAGCDQPANQLDGLRVASSRTSGGIRASQRARGKARLHSANAASRLAAFSALKYSRYSRVSRLAIQAHRPPRCNDGLSPRASRPREAAADRILTSVLPVSGGDAPQAPRAPHDAGLSGHVPRFTSGTTRQRLVRRLIARNAAYCRKCTDAARVSWVTSAALHTGDPRR